MLISIRADQNRGNTRLDGHTCLEKSAMSWVVETTGDATCMKDYISMNAPVVELLSAEDLILALHYLDPTLSSADTKSLYKKGQLGRYVDCIRGDG